MQTSVKAKKNKSTVFLMLFLILLPFEYPLANLGVGSILRYVGILTMGIAAIDIINAGSKIVIDYRVTLLMLWLIYAFSSTLWCVDESAFVRYYSMYLNNALMFLLITLVKYDKAETKNIKKAYVLGIALLFLYMTFVPGAVTYSSWQSRLTLASSTGEELIDQNYLAAIISMPFGIVFYELVNGKNKKFLVRVFEILFCIMSFYYVFMTGSRSGLLAMIGIVVFNVLKGLKKHLVKVFIVLALISILSPQIVKLMPDDLMNRYSADAMTGNTSESDDRLLIWNVAIKSVNNQRVVYGYGAGSSEEIIGRNWKRRAAIHNAALACVVEMGIIGLILLGGLISSLIKELFKNKRVDVIIPFIGILVESMFLDVLTTKFFWGAMLFLTVCINGERKRQQTNVIELENDT